ncbi:MAG: tetratricopeptide repeat protein [Lachnospiraceae bacterium]|nr:tetratricopeptide repeat protein [Lachnospiraceae bacterium]
MDKYEFNIKVEQMRKLVNKGDFETALKIADTIDWKKVRNANLLSMVAQIYEKNREYQDAKDILLLAFERAPIGKRLLFKLTDLALKEENVDEAEAYYREFCDLAGDDPRQFLLRYMILKQKGAPVEQLIHSLESYTAEELDEKWLYELAELYHEAGDADRCVSTCDKIMLMFGLGKYVDKAMELKIQYAPLTKYQMDLVENRDKYEEKLRAVEQSFEGDIEISEDNEISMERSEESAEPEELYSEEEEDTAEPVSEPEFVPEDLIVPVPEPEKVVADVKQAEIERKLAKEMSRLKEDVIPEEDSELGKTRVLTELKRASIVEEAPAEEPEEPMMDDLDVAEEEPELPKMANHLMIEARTPEKGLEIAIQTLKQIQKETGIKNPVAKITGSKMNKRGVLASAEKLRGKDLMIEEAGDLSHEMLKELEKLMTQDTSGMRIILIDNPKQMEMLHAQNPSLADKFECIGSDYPYQPEAVKTEPQAKPQPVQEPEKDDRPVRVVKPKREGVMRVPDPVDQEVEAYEEVPAEEEMDIDEFAQYACKYASEIDCSITGKSMLALYERIEIMEEDGIPLTRTTAEELIEDAADRAEKPSLGKLITGIFSSKYDKDGLLVLKEEHFI